MKRIVISGYSKSNGGEVKQRGKTTASVFSVVPLVKRKQRLEHRSSKVPVGYIRVISTALLYEMNKTKGIDCC